MPNKNLLIVGNFHPNVGYAWNTISEYFLALGKAYVGRGLRAMIAYPSLPEIPRKFREADIELFPFDFKREPASALYRFVKDNGISTVYLTDQPVFSPRYLVCRLAGAANVVVHDRTSGSRDEPGVLKRSLKKVINSRPGVSADRAIAISDFVRRRLIEVSCFPEARITRIWNGVNIDRYRPEPADDAYRLFDIPRERKIVLVSSRANRYKGVQVLIEAAAMLVNNENRTDVQFLYCGDGPDLGHFRDLVEQKGLSPYFLCPGRTDGMDRIVRSATVVVVPSIWQEGFGLSVVEGMAAGKVVVASRVGGIVEIITDGEDGFLFPAGDAVALSGLLTKALARDDLRAAIGQAARRTAVERFNIEDKKRELVRVITELGTAGEAAVPVGSREKLGRPWADPRGGSEER